MASGAGFRLQIAFFSVVGLGHWVRDFGFRVKVRDFRFRVDR